MAASTKNYNVHFKFTTVRGNRFTGRTGKLNIDSMESIEAMKLDNELNMLCISYILDLKPSYKIIDFQITNIEPK